MVKRKSIGLDFEIDKLTNSIENVITKDSFATEVSIVTMLDLKDSIWFESQDNVGTTFFIDFPLKYTDEKSY